MAASFLQNQRRTSRRTAKNSGFWQRLRGALPLVRLPDLAFRMPRWSKKSRHGTPGWATKLRNSFPDMRLRRSLGTHTFGRVSSAFGGVSNAFGGVSNAFGGVSNAFKTAASGPNWAWISRAPRSSARLRDWSPYGLIALVSPQSRRVLVIGLGITLALFCSWIFLFAPKGLIARNDLRATMSEKREEIEALKRTNRELQQQIAMLTSDTDTIESIARNELNLALPGETIYRTVREDGPPRYVLNPSTRSPGNP